MPNRPATFGGGPGPESVGIALYAVDPDAGKWDKSTWDGGYWGAYAWNRVDCQIEEVTARWGATDEAGILSLTSAGEIDLATFDPLRILDPTNSASPFYGAVRPGTPVRLLGITGTVGAIANPSFELTPPLTGWTASAPALATQTAMADAYSGAYVLTLTADGVTGSPAVSQVVAVPAGARVTASVTTRCSPGISGRMRIDGLGATGAVIASGLLMVTSTANVYETIGGSFVVPPDVSAIRLHLYQPAVYAAGLLNRFDAVTLVIDPPSAATGFIDDATYDVAAQRGRIRAIDGVAYLAQSQYPENVAMPNTLRTRVRWIVQTVGLGPLIPVEGEAPTDPDIDPPVAPHDMQSGSAWELIARAAEDALTIIWLDPTGMLRFRSWGALPDSGVNLGCPDADSADELWLPGLSTVLATASAGPVRNSVRAYSAGTTWQAAKVDTLSRNKYGPRPFDVERIVPDFANWAQRILDDRADAGLEIAIGEVRPFDATQLAALLSIDGPQTVRVRDDEHGTPIDFDAGVIGATLGVTAAGWRWQYVTTIPRVQWETEEPPPVTPPTPPTDPWHVETRSYVANADALLALTSGGAKYGAGAATSLPVGGWQGWTYRSVVKFPSIPFTKVRAIRSATLKLTTTSQVRIGFGSNPKLELRRITSNWSAGSSSSPSSGNSVVWPGPNTTTTGAVTAAMPGGQGVQKSIVCTALVKAWGPTSIGGSGAAQYGIELREISASQTYTTEVWPQENGTAANRPTLVLELEVFD